MLKSVPQENFPVAQVSLPEVLLQVCKSPPKKLVVEAVVVKRLVEVALVPVALMKVKFWRVLEPLSKRLAKVPSPVAVKLPPFAVVKNKFVEEAVVEKRLVEVALPEIKTLPLTESLSLGVEEPMPKKPLALIVRAAVVEVAVPATVVVAK